MGYCCLRLVDDGLRRFDEEVDVYRWLDIVEDEGYLELIGFWFEGFFRINLYLGFCVGLLFLLTELG